MSNTYFQFKQFTVHQGNTAMKVTTDACIFGASINLVQEECNVLDVGAGTGVLSLMLAQRYPKAQFTAVEIDVAAAQQCSQNFAASPFAQQLTCEQQDYFNTSFLVKFQHIVCNPPYFEKQLASANTNKALAWHSTQFSLGLFIDKARGQLLPTGTIWLMLPYQRWQHLQDLCSRSHLTVLTVMDVFNQTTSLPHLRLFEITQKANTTLQQHTQLIIRNSQTAYSANFAALLTDYYLNL